MHTSYANAHVVMVGSGEMDGIRFQGKHVLHDVRARASCKDHAHGGRVRVAYFAFCSKILPCMRYLNVFKNQSISG